MKKLLLAVVLSVLLLTGCGTTTTTPSATVTTSTVTTTRVVTGTLVPFVELPVPGPSSTMYPDDLVITPGGYAYRGNVSQEGQVNPWPHVETVITALTSGNETVTAFYRNDIVTNAGQVRNDLVILSGQAYFSGDHTLDLYGSGVPAGFTLNRYGSAGLMGQIGTDLRLDIASSVAPGDYSFSLGVVVDGAYLGALPIAVHVVTEPANTPLVPLSVLPSATVIK